MKQQSRFCKLLCVISLAAIGAPGWAGTAQAADGTWNVDSTGNWSDTAKWLGGTIADGVGATANITFNITSSDDKGPAIDGAVASRTLGILNIGDYDATHRYKITSINSGKLTFDNGLANAQLNQVSTSNGDTISVPILLRGSIDITNYAAAKTLTISTGVTSIAISGTQTISNLGTAAGNVTMSGVIGDGSSGGKIALVQNNANDILTLSGTNTFTGGVTLSAGTLKVGNAKALGATAGKLTITGGTLDSDGMTISNNNPQGWNGDFTYSGVSGNLNLGDGAVTMNASRKVTVSASGSILTVGGAIGDGGGGYGLTKLGAGTLTLNGSAVNTFTGGLSIYAGALELDFANLGTPTNLIDSGNTLTLGSGTLSIKGKTGAFSTGQTFSSLTVNGGGAILLNPKGGTGTTISLGSIATIDAIGHSLLVGKASGAGSGDAIITTTGNKDSQGIYDVHVLYTDGTTSNYNWATTASVSSPYTFGAYGTAYGAYTTMVAGATSDALNDITTGSLTLTGAHTHNTLKLTNGATLALGANTLTIASGGLLSTGAVASTISGAAGATRLMGGDNGSGSYDLIVHQYNTGGLMISAVIGDNGAHPTALTKSGAGELTLSGANTYTGDTIVTKGTLSISNAYLNDAAAVKIDLDARMNLNFGGEDQIAELWLGGAQMAPGYYYMGMPGTEGYGSYFTGAGSLHVVLVRLPGDANLDGVVDAADYITVKQNFGMTSGATWAQGNFTVDTVGDGTVDWTDLQILMANFGHRSGTGAPAVPEPATLGLLAIGALAVIRHRRSCLRPCPRP